MVLLFDQLLHHLERVGLKHIIDNLTFNQQFEVQSAGKFIADFLPCLCEISEILIVGQVGLLCWIFIDKHAIFLNQFCRFVLQSKKLSQGGRVDEIEISAVPFNAEICINFFPFDILEVRKIVIGFLFQCSPHECY